MKLQIPCLLLFGLALAGCSGRRGPIDPSLSVFIPPDTVALVGVRMDQLRATPIYRKLEGRKSLPRFDEFRTDSGFDPGRDVRELLLAADGENTLAIAHGVFEAKPPGGLPTTGYRGYTLLAKDSRAVIVFLDRSTALGGAPEMVRAAIDQYKSGARRAPPDLLARAQSVSGDAQIWAVVSGWKGLGRDRLSEMGNAGNLDRVLRSLHAASLTVDLRSGMHAAATGECPSELEARTLAEQLGGLAGAARIGVRAGQTELLRALDGIRVAQEGRSVKLHIDIAPDLTDKLLDKIR